MTTRQEKINSLLKREIAAYLQEQGFEGVTGLLTITSADVTPDLEEAKIFFSVVGQDEVKVLDILKKQIYQVQGMLLKKLKMRKIPKIDFVPDYSGENVQRIGQIIRKLHEDDDPR
ncbi:MAG: 30S ribosome-binding factor RbfA [Candidatus Doudnabacteria bacterium]|nr:30S ribosome-binding factor RbfA [Candidatus Doudnabacteria bacterium]